MFDWIDSTHGPIGLDLGQRWIKAVQLRRRGGQLRGWNAARLPRDQPASGSAPPERGLAPLSPDEGRRLVDLLRRRHFVGRAVVLCVPAQAALTGVLELPPASSGAPLDVLARQELAHMHRCDPTALEAAFWELPPSARAADGVPVMAVGCRHEDASPLIEAVEAAGLRVTGLDVAGWAVARVALNAAARGATDQTAGLTAALDLGWGSATLVLLCQGTVIYERSVPAAGLRLLHEQLAREHGLNDETIEYALHDVGFLADERAREDDWRLLVKTRAHLDAHFESVAAELQLAARYGHHQYPAIPLERVLLTGGAAAIPGLAPHLATATDLPTSVLTPADALALPAEPADSRLPGMVIAAGLALWSQKGALRCAA